MIELTRRQKLGGTAATAFAVAVPFVASSPVAAAAQVLGRQCPAFIATRSAVSR